jgi:hypothetical protein
MCRRSEELRTSGRLKIRRCSRSWLYVARQSWVGGRLCDQLRLSHCFGSVNPCLDGKCRNLAFLLGFSGWETRVTTFWSFYILAGGGHMENCEIYDVFRHLVRLALYQGTTLVVP